MDQIQTKQLLLNAEYQTYKEVIKGLKDEEI